VCAGGRRGRRKVGGSAIAARATAIPWRDAAVIGVLLNARARGAVILNVGLDIGSSRELFAMMVLSEVVPTAMIRPPFARTSRSSAASWRSAAATAR
jgi:Kef-type K+ transport system membrane component KefB